jgi:enoyl-CoA hydratase/carnithine racemase
VGTLVLDRPDRKNALTFDSYAELRDTFRALATAADVKVVVLTGAGADFCSGGDVREIVGRLIDMDAKARRTFTKMTVDVVKAMRACPQPIVAAVDGVCAGAGAVLALASDLRLGTPRARVAFLFVRVGLSGADMGAAALLPRVVGLGRAAELLYTGRTLEPEEALRWGFFQRLVTPESLAAEAGALAKTLASGPTRAHAETKRMLDREQARSLEDALDEEAEVQAVLMGTADFARAYRAFVEKRQPDFRGD